MRHTHLAKLAFLMFVLPAMTGCIIVHKHTEHETTTTCDTEYLYMDDQATIAEINAVHSLDFSSERAEHLARIAHRPGIGADAQVCLIDTAFEVLDFESEKLNVLHTLIKNPTLTSAGKSRILSRLNDLDFSSNRKSILKALDRRGPVVEYVHEPATCEDQIVIQVPHNQAQPSETPKAE